MADRLVQVLASDRAHQPLALHHEDPALAVPLAGDHGRRHRLVGRDGAGRLRHQVAGAGLLTNGLGERREHTRTRLVEGVPEDGRGCLRMSAAAELGGHCIRVERRRAATDHAEDAVVHLHQQHQRLGDSVDVARPGDRGQEHLDARRLVGLARLEQTAQQLPLVAGERRVQERAEQVLSRAVPQAPGERLGVALSGRGVRQRAGVLVDSERENGGFQRRDRDLALGEHSDQCRRQRPVLRYDRIRLGDPVGKVCGVVVEDDRLDLRVARNPLQLAEPTCVDSLDDDQPADGVEVEARDLDKLQLVRVQAVELAHVSVEGAGQADDGAGVQAPCGQHRREGVEIRVGVRRDDLLGLHLARIVALAALTRERRPRSRPAPPTGARRPRASRVRAGSRPRASDRPRSSPGSWPDR